MQNLIKFFRNKITIFIFLLLISVPTFIKMVRPGIYSTQDFHFFRLVEIDKCIKDFQIPCRWAGDAGLGYGEPVFNYYGQTSYILGEVIHLFGVSLIDSFKILFAFSLIASAYAMYLLSRKIWKSNSAALISSVIYLYAPYRAVDVWVRGALPEAFSFILFPLIVLELEYWFESFKLKYLIFYSIFLSLLITTHNLSFLMFLIFLIPWLIYKSLRIKETKKLYYLLFYSFFAFVLSSYYLLPVFLESRFINLRQAVTQGYFNFRGHFVSLYQLLISRYWGYGASVFGTEDGLNLSVGLLQWIIPIISLIFIYFKSKNNNDNLNKILLFTSIGWFSLFLTHNKSTLIWENISYMEFIQFPWRFLSIAVFCFSLGSGAIVSFSRKINLYVTILIIIFSFFLTRNYFREDIWYNFKDSDLTSGERWIEQTRASIKDFWPIFSNKLPASPAPKNFDNQELILEKSNMKRYRVILNKENNWEVFPVTFFPGWVASINGKSAEIKPLGELGLIGINIPSGNNIIDLTFKDTFIRKIGNLLSLLAILLIPFLFRTKNYVKK